MPADKQPSPRGMWKSYIGLASVAAFTVFWVWLGIAVVKPFSAVKSAGEKTYLTKTVPHEDAVKWNWLKVTTESSKFYMDGGKGEIIHIPDNSVDFTNFRVTSDPPGELTVTTGE